MGLSSLLFIENMLKSLKKLTWVLYNEIKKRYGCY